MNNIVLFWFLLLQDSSYPSIWNWRNSDACSAEEFSYGCKKGNTIDSGFQVGMCSRKTCMSTPIGESVIKGLSNGLSTIIRI